MAVTAIHDSLTGTAVVRKSTEEEEHGVQDGRWKIQRKQTPRRDVQIWYKTKGTKPRTRRQDLYLLGSEDTAQSKRLDSMCLSQIPHFQHGPAQMLTSPPSPCRETSEIKYLPKSKAINISRPFHSFK